MLIVCFLAAAGTQAQSPNATVTGQVLDSSAAVIAGAEVDVISDATNLIYSTKTNTEGIFMVPDVPPATYHVQVSHVGFKTIVKPDIILNVREAVALNFSLPVGAISETVTVEGGAPMINTEDAAVSTVVDRHFAENLPLNGRSFQTLIQLTPGVVLTANDGLDSGQFSVNGQRASANYWMVDGVSANIGVSAAGNSGNGLGGTLGSFSALGGTNSLVSVDAMQEFRIQTSTFAPEFGRTPGAQISIVTRSGTNQFHGTAFEYFRNDALDANNWFADSAGLTKPKERQNDFGGTFSGPILRDRTFFFFSYEGLRLQLPQTLLTSVPDLGIRITAVSGMRPYLNAYPLPNGTDNTTTGVAQFNASFSNPASLTAVSLRIDHKLNRSITAFARYNYSPSEIDQRGASGTSLSTVSPTQIRTETATLGTAWVFSSTVTNDIRFNYSNTDSSSAFLLDQFGGAVLLSTPAFPSPFTSANSEFNLLDLALLSSNGTLALGKNAHTVQRQINIVDSISVEKGPHALKFGIDLRRLTPQFSRFAYEQVSEFSNMIQEGNGTPIGTVLTSSTNPTFLFRNLGLFAQDTWRASARLTLTYGLRWDVDFSPSSLNGPSLNSVTGFNLNNLSNLTIANTGTPPFQTKYGNLAPRIGVAYQLSQVQNWNTVFRSGFGVFYDLSSAEAGNIAAPSAFPFGSTGVAFGSFPLSAVAAAPPPIVAPNSSNGGVLYAFDPGLRLPYTLEWNIAAEQSMGNEQTLTVTYLGSAGRRLIQTSEISKPNVNYATAILVTNAAVSNYQALQVQFQRRLSDGLQLLSSYVWSHSIDTASAGSIGNGANDLVATLSANANRGPSDFDIRNAFSAGVTYDLPSPRIGAFPRALLKGWSTENVVQTRSAPPVNVYYSAFQDLSSGFFTQVRPDVVPGTPLYLYGSGYPGGMAFNRSAFKSPALSMNGLPQSQGDLGRNALRGFGATEWDFAIHRDFPIHESTKLQFRAEVFNVLNHPNFGQPAGNLGSPTSPNVGFGKSSQILSQSLGGTVGAGGGAFNALYQLGGPRSVQLALKLDF
jgi:hypothetical protein